MNVPVTTEYFQFVILYKYLKPKWKTIDSFKFPNVFKSYHILKIYTCKYNYKVQNRKKIF